VSAGPVLAELQSGDKRAMAAALARIEQAPEAAATLALLEAAWTAPRAHVLGVTGPPGVGKSMLTARLIRLWRNAGERIGVIAVDPSSAVSGGALLGDRLRLAFDDPDPGLFIRSMAARDRLGGLAPDTVAAMALMRAVYDRVLIETVGVGQSETDIAVAADTVLLCLQPASGDTVQFMKAGIVEVPDLVAVTKADLGPLAQATAASCRAAIGPAGGVVSGRVAPVLLASASVGSGVAELAAAIDDHRAWLGEGDRLSARRRAQSERWLLSALRERVGSEGLRRLDPAAAAAAGSPFTRLHELTVRLR
jgi:GTPase